VDFPGMIHVYVRSDGLGIVIISDDAYPQRVAYYLLSDVRLSMLFIWFLYALTFEGHG
jgi:hypothetical protein